MTAPHARLRALLLDAATAAYQRIGDPDPGADREILEAIVDEQIQALGDWQVRPMCLTAAPDAVGTVDCPGHVCGREAGHSGTSPWHECRRCRGRWDHQPQAVAT